MNFSFAIEKLLMPGQMLPELFDQTLTMIKYLFDVSVETVDEEN